VSVLEGGWPIRQYRRTSKSPPCVVGAVQYKPAALDVSKQSVFELGALAYRMVTGRAVTCPTAPTLPEEYPDSMQELLPRLVHADPGTEYSQRDASFKFCTPSPVHCTDGEAVL
jgi:hypothetical protein